MKKYIVACLLILFVYACKKDVANNRKLTYTVTLPMGHKVVINYNSDYNMENNKQESVVYYTDTIPMIWESKRIANANEGYYLKVEYTDIKHYYLNPDSTYAAQVAIDDDQKLLDSVYYKNVIVIQGKIQ